MLLRVVARLCVVVVSLCTVAPCSPWAMDCSLAPSSANYTGVRYEDQLRARVDEPLDLVDDPVDRRTAVVAHGEPGTGKQPECQQVVPGRRSIHLLESRAGRSKIAHRTWINADSAHTVPRRASVRA